MGEQLTAGRPTCAIASAQIRDYPQRALSRLPDSVIDKASALADERRRQYLTGRALLAELLMQTAGIATLPDIITGDNGRPAFQQTDLPDFNISHSGDVIMVAVSQNGRIGIDLELKRPRKKLMSLAQYSFSDDEYQWLCTLGEEEREAAFWQLWTLRESILKLAGKGVWQMKEISIAPNERRLNAAFSPLLNCWSYADPYLFWAIAAGQPLPKESLSLWQASEDLTSLVARPLPALTRFRSDLR